MTKPGFLENPRVRQWLGGTEPAWTALTHESFSALCHEPSATSTALRLANDLTLDELETLLYHESGVLGLSGISADFRELERSDDPAAAFAIDVFVYRVANAIGALASAIGGIPETQEVLDFCAERGIMPDCEMIPIQEINRAYERMERADVKYRFVIDMASLTA